MLLAVSPAILAILRRPAYLSRLPPLDLRRSQSTPGLVMPATNEQLLLLHQELAALARAGLPLDGGLRALAHELPGRLGQLANELAERLERGENVAEALRTSGTPQERVYA